MKRLVVVLVMGFLLWPGVGRPEEVQQKPRTIGAEFAKGVFSPVLSVVYFPVKFCVGGVVGAVLGGVSGWATGGNERAAEGIWRPMVGGTYFITPQVLDGEKPFLPFNGGPYSPPPAQAVTSGSPYSSGSVYMQP